MTTNNPPERTEGLGEMIRAMRLYIGLSQREISRTLKMDRRTYQRIENGQELCPVGFIDTMRTLTDEFDEQVDATINQAGLMVENRLAGAPGHDDDVVHFNVTDRDDDAWTRAVIGRAAFESDLIMPMLTAIPGATVLSISQNTS